MLPKGYPATNISSPPTTSSDLINPPDNTGTICIASFCTKDFVSTKWSNRQEDMSTKDIYKIASKQTVMVVCHR